MEFAASYYNVPERYWNMLPVEDQQEYIKMRESFSKVNMKEKNYRGFDNDLRVVRQYIDRRPEQKQERSVICGIFFAKNFIAVNISQLKIIIGRCKSSINNGFVLLGFISAKIKVKKCIESVLPIISKDTSIIRQWTIRCLDKKIIPLTMPINKGVHKKSSFDPKKTNFNIGRPVHLPTPIVDQVYIPDLSLALSSDKQQSGISKKSGSVFSFTDEQSDTFPDLFPFAKESNDYGINEGLNWHLQDHFYD